MTKTGGKHASLVQLGTAACPKLFRSRRQEAAVLRHFCACAGRDGPTVFVCSFLRRLGLNAEYKGNNCMEEVSIR